MMRTSYDLLDWEDKHWTHGILYSSQLANMAEDEDELDEDDLDDPELLPEDDEPVEELDVDGEGFRVGPPAFFGLACCCFDARSFEEESPAPLPGLVSPPLRAALLPEGRVLEVKGLLDLRSRRAGGPAIR
ncbi:unnamed protein product [Mesocestoides corti]|uniref:Coordinator of PRMT5 and differentiation stimulator n=1 Tax=Mesocestoides corti TaxID=53468 RepID=A0A0R3U112_MESCO|nr:unnamed protein product [Mesocestoides corti]